MPNFIKIDCPYNIKYICKTDYVHENVTILSVPKTLSAFINFRRKLSTFEWNISEFRKLAFYKSANEKVWLSGTTETGISQLKQK